MTRQAVSTPFNLREGVRSPAGRPLPAHLVAEAPPHLDADARRLLEPLLGSASVVDSSVMLDFAKRQAASPSRPGIQAVAYLAWSCREAARKKYPDEAEAEGAIGAVLGSMSTTSAAILNLADAGEARVQKLLEVSKAAITKAYAAGHAAGQDELRKQLPAVVRETTFITDSKDRVIGKTEREYKPGGKS